MKLAFKQLMLQLLGERVFTALLFLMALLTSLSFFFVRFSIDGNMTALASGQTLSENQLLFRKAMESNTSLARAFLAALTCLTAFVIVLFFYRFFRANSRHLGCLKSLGFRDGTLCMLFTGFIVTVCLSGGLCGLAGGYFLSDVLNQAYRESYEVSGLVRAVNLPGIFAGLILPTLIFCATAILCYGLVSGKEPGMLLAGKQTGIHMSFPLRLADKITSVLPVKTVTAQPSAELLHKTKSRSAFPRYAKPALRIALRRPVAVFFIFAAVMTFHVFFMLGHSLNKSSEKVYEMQTAGRSYEYDIRYSSFYTGPAFLDGMTYIETPALVSTKGKSIKQTAAGFYNSADLYRLLDTAKKPLPVPESGTVYITPGLSVMYDINIHDTLTLEISGQSLSLSVADIVWNGTADTVYCNAAQLARLSGVSDGAYNGMLSNTQPGDGGFAQSKSRRLAALRRDAVSNRVSAVINQLTGVLVGCILIFLALYLNFEDNKQDMLILDMLGFHRREISRLLVNVYGPVVWAAFLLTWLASILLTQSIQRSLSLMTGDYMPFGAAPPTALYAFLLLNVMYLTAQSALSAGIGRVLKKGDILKTAAAE